MALIRWFKKMSRPRLRELDPDEIFLDSRNLPSFNTQQFEGQLEKPINKTVFYLFTIGVAVVAGVLLGKVALLQVVNGQALAARSESNSLRHQIIFPERGILYDRHGEELAWNDPDRLYITTPGFGHILGFIGYPTAEELTTTDFDHKELIGREGAEKLFNNQLAGAKGIKIEEINVGGGVVSDHFLTMPESGQSLVLSVDADIQAELYQQIKNLSEERGFAAGAGIIMDVTTGEIIALTSYPDFDPNVMATGTNREAINEYLTDPRSPFLNRAVSGLYTPGSIIKPFMAAAALAERVISPDKTIVSTGQLVVPNPYNPEEPSIFKDWQAHGAVDMRRALAVSSNVYFYQIGGGFGGQAGLGINKINEYVRLFGFGAPTGINLTKENKGVIPSPEWKEENFPGQPWRLGDTYHTVIGQYGFLVSPIQVVRAVAGISTGALVKPTLLKADGTATTVAEPLPLANSDLAVVREGMRLAVTEGTAQGLSLPAVRVAAKTGTAELGTLKEDVNSWVIGFWPYEAPRYAFVVVMEKGSRSNLIGGVAVMRRVLDWLAIYKPEYFSI